MYGAIIGDIIGSVYEFHNIKAKDFPLFRDDCHFTDDTVMTCAVAEGCMNGGTKDEFLKAMVIYGRKYPRAGYGRFFRKWLYSDDFEPYNSFATVRQCAYLPEHGKWTAVSMPEPDAGLPTVWNAPAGPLR